MLATIKKGEDDKKALAKTITRDKQNKLSVTHGSLKSLGALV